MQLWLELAQAKSVAVAAAATQVLHCAACSEEGVCSRAAPPVLLLCSSCADHVRLGHVSQVALRCWRSSWGES